MFLGFVFFFKKSPSVWHIIDIHLPKMKTLEAFISGCITNNQHKNMKCWDERCSDQNCSQWPQHETQEAWFTTSFRRDTPKVLGTHSLLQSSDKEEKFPSSQKSWNCTTIPYEFIMGCQFEALLQMLAPYLRGQSSSCLTSPTDGWYFPHCWLQDLCFQHLCLVCQATLAAKGHR